MSDSLSLPSHFSSIEGQAPTEAQNTAPIGQKPGQPQLDHQKLETLITEKLNTFEGAPGKQELRQMMKEVVQELLQEKGGKAADGQPGASTTASSLKGQLPLGNTLPDQPKPSLAGSKEGFLKETASGMSMPQGAGNDKFIHKNQSQNSSPMDMLNPNLVPQGHPLPQMAETMPSTAAFQNVQASREAATQMIADLANQIVDRIQVNTNTLANMQEVRISFGNNILPNTEVVINLTGNQLNITFVAGSQQAAQFLSQQNLSQLQNSLKTKLGDDKSIHVSLKKGESEEGLGVATERAVRRKEGSNDASGF